MRRALVALLIASIAFHPAVVQAGQSGSAQAPPPPAPAIQQALPPLVPAKEPPNVESYGVSFDRIKQILGDRKPTDDKNGLKLNYFVEVVAEAPPIVLFTKQDLAPGGPMPFAFAPTHADIVDQLTPVQFKGGEIPVSAIAIAGIIKLIEWQAAKIRREKLEEERKKADEEERARQQKLQESGLVIKKRPL